MSLKYKIISVIVVLLISVSIITTYDRNTYSFIPYG